MYPAPLSRGDVQQFPERADETCLIGKATLEGDLYHRQPGMQKKLFGCVYALLQEPAIRRLPNRLLESADEMTDRQLAFTRDLRERDLSIQVGLQHLGGAVQLPWSQPSTHD